jgi:parallel beta-helix repeat protein
MVNAVCIVPAENMEIKENAVFCYGAYNIENGLNIANDNVIVDCNNSFLVGGGINYGILLNNRHNVIIQNCSISNYEVGIYLEDTNSSVIKDNRLTKNKFGIALFNSFNNDVRDNFLFENINNIINYLPISMIQEKPIKTEAKEEIGTPEKRGQVRPVSRSH